MPNFQPKIVPETLSLPQPLVVQESETSFNNIKHERDKIGPPPPPPPPPPPLMKRIPTPPLPKTSTSSSAAPAPAPPSALIVAFARMVEAESQLDYAYAKHAQIIRKRKILRAQIEKLEKLPVGYDTFKKDLEKLISDLTSSKTTAQEAELTALEEEEAALMEVYVNH